MSTIVLTDPSQGNDGPAQRLRRVAAAVRVHFTWWGVHRTLTTQQKEEVSAAYAADAHLLTAGKKIVDVKHQAFRRLTSIRGAVVQFWRGLTLPYVEAGVRLIKQADVEMFAGKMEEFRDELLKAEADLNQVFDQIKADARRRLGRLYCADDYPPEVRGLFNVSWDFPSVEPPNYLLRLNPEIYQQEQERITRRFEEAVRLAEQAFVTEFSKLVEHLTERLSGGADGERKIFRDSAVENLAAFFERFKHLNVNSCAQLDELVNEAQRLIHGVAPQDLRDSQELRQQVSTQLSRVQAALDGMMVDRPRRSIVRQRRVQEES